jgi:serine/tyrosine/threonine adenylyltransferase
MHAKLGLADGAPDGDALIADLLALMGEQHVDYTACLRSLSSVVRGDSGPTHALFADPDAFDGWATRWSARLGDDRAAIAAAMDGVNPVYIPRNHIVEEVLTAASWGDVASFETFLDVLVHPYVERRDGERYAQPADSGSVGSYRTFCGT